MATAKTAITEDGRRLVLGADGEWSYEEPHTDTTESRNFRDTSWGMTREEVMHTESVELVKQNPEGLIYRTRLSKFPALIVYMFARKHLVRAKYNLLIEHASPFDYISDFEFVQSLLVRKYGASSKTHYHWIDDRYREDEHSWGRAVALGHLILWDSWQVNGTEISLMLRSEEQGIVLEIEYSSMELEHMAEESELDSDLKGL